MPQFVDPANSGAKCSFCGKNQKQVTKMIAGPGVYICNECVDLCQDILTEEMPEPPPLAVAMEEYRQRLYELGSQIGELAKQVRERARSESRDPSQTDA